MGNVKRSQHSNLNQTSSLQLLLLNELYIARRLRDQNIFSLRYSAYPAHDEEATAYFTGIVTHEDGLPHVSETQEKV
jgi:hypothetical protein